MEMVVAALAPRLAVVGVAWLNRLDSAGRAVFETLDGQPDGLVGG
jgi:hypothetical protein